MDYKEALREGLKKSLVTKGRDTREQFWRFFIVYFPIATVIPTFIVLSLLTILSYNNLAILYLILAISCIIVYIPVVSAIIRRLHDVGKSGYYWILWFVPGVNLYVFYLLAKKGIAKIQTGREA